MWLLIYMQDLHTAEHICSSDAAKESCKKVFFSWQFVQNLKNK